MQKWVTEQTITQQQSGISVRELLRLWLIPKRMQHFLRVRQDVLVNGVYRPYSMLVEAGDVVRLVVQADELQTPMQTYLSDSQQVMPILYENDDLLVINKPTGIKSHPNRPDEAGTVMNFLTAQLASQNVRPAMVHRLDMATSGAMIVAKTPIVVPILDRLIGDKTIARTYKAWVAGHFDNLSGEFTNQIGRDPDDRRKRALDGLQPQTALTYYKVLREAKTATLVELTLATGRTHQLRVHLAGNGHAILGDPLYASVLEQRAASRLMLHAANIRLKVPFTDEIIDVGAVLPKDFVAYDG
ncbi:RluA family pseudouridine synthase [Furfurilactobacillus siliginis]|uniref:Pseudouridine synthase n=1 Tax=Furfurilactobacillus siliginis TaxID=348151 RepID=A0A0R2L3Y9_9LACO|nr:RluA family pseudouridine synthase [Furfurilactobacillus siliginis]KRN96411.1 ribosomal large subunit pseudouridine synthase d [Furfurilactobacillus siliginis]